MAANESPDFGLSAKEVIKRYNKTNFVIAIYINKHCLGRQASHIRSMQIYGTDVIGINNIYESNITRYIYKR